MYLYSEEKAFSQCWADDADATNRNGHFKTNEPGVHVCVYNTMCMFGKNHLSIYTYVYITAKNYFVISELLFQLLDFISTCKREGGGKGRKEEGREIHNEINIHLFPPSHLHQASFIKKQKNYIAQTLSLICKSMYTSSYASIF